PRIDEAMSRGHGYLLERKLFRSKRTGDVIRSEFTRFAFPPTWRYDVLRALDHLRDAGTTPDPRLDEAIALVKRKRRKDGAWTRQNRYSGEYHFELEAVGEPSRMNTLRALRVLRWWGGETS